MCGRFALTTPPEQLAEIFEAEDRSAAAGRAPRFNICPTQEVEAILSTPEGRVIERMRWGFIPAWFKTPTNGPLLINARSETIASKPAFAESARYRRCLIPASGFYEWRVEGEGVRRPFWVAPADGEITAFAGIWRDWAGADGLKIRSAAIVTTAANEALKGIHPRTPLAIAPEGRALWLGEAGHGAARLMTPPAEDFWAFHEGGPEIGKAKADGPDLMAPAGANRLI